MPEINRQWRLARRPVGTIETNDLEWREAPLPSLGQGDVRVRHIYLSLDPTNRIWMSDMVQYMPPVAIGEVMRGGTLGVVEESLDPSLNPGDIVSGLGGWQDYFVGPAQYLRKTTPPAGVPLTALMSIFGTTGLTAYFGLLDIGRPEQGETVVVSAAAGAVGSIVGQIAKIKGCRVIGIAGSDEKCAWITDELGFDGAINYRTENVQDRLSALCPDGIDVDFENVGGEILDTVLTQINLNARIVICGLISSYNATEPVPGPYHFANILMKRAIVQGFIILDFVSRFPEGVAALAQWLAEGRLKYEVDIVGGLENAPTAVNRLFTGGHTGKLLVQVSPEPE